MKKIILVTILCIIADWSHAQSSIKAVGVLRHDGIVVPLAIFDGNAFQDISERDLHEIGDKRPDWFFISDSVATLQISTMVIYEPYSMVEGVGFISSYTRESIHNTGDKAQGAVYTWLPSAVTDFNMRNMKSQHGDNLTEVIEQRFKMAEAKIVLETDHREIDGVAYADYVPVDSALRDSLQIEQTVLSTEVPLGAKTLSYVSAKRWYPRAGCRFKAVLEAWVVEEPNKNPSVVHSSMTADLCDGKSLAGSIDQIEAFELNGKLFVVNQSWGYEGGGYSVLQLEKNNFKYFYQK